MFLPFFYQPVVAVYPGLCIAGVIRNAIPSLRKMLGAWAQQIRDSEFLVEMRLRNLEHSDPKVEARSEGGLTEPRDVPESAPVTPVEI